MKGAHVQRSLATPPQEAPRRRGPRRLQEAHGGPMEAPWRPQEAPGVQGSPPSSAEHTGQGGGVPAMHELNTCAPTGKLSTSAPQEPPGKRTRRSESGYYYVRSPRIAKGGATHTPPLPRRGELGGDRPSGKRPRSFIAEIAQRLPRVQGCQQFDFPRHLHLTCGAHAVLCDTFC